MVVFARTNLLNSTEKAARIWVLVSGVTAATASAAASTSARSCAHGGEGGDSAPRRAWDDDARLRAQGAANLQCSGESGRAGQQVQLLVGPFQQPARVCRQYSCAPPRVAQPSAARAQGCGRGESPWGFSGGEAHRRTEPSVWSRRVWPGERRTQPAHSALTAVPPPVRRRRATSSTLSLRLAPYWLVAAAPSHPLALHPVDTHPHASAEGSALLGLTPSHKMPALTGLRRHQTETVSV
jgi:hypothetical protein